MSSTTTSSPTAACVTMTPGKYGYVPSEACNANYAYNPSFPAAIVAAALFGLMLAVHFLQSIIYRKVSGNIVRHLTSQLTNSLNA